MPTNQSLIECNITALNEGVELLSLLNSSQYVQGYKPAFQSTIGAHFRHILEHYQCFFLQHREGQFCYDSRKRDQKLELDINYANCTIDEVLESFGTLNDDDFNRHYVIFDQQASGEVVTTLQRELLFLQSHTTHHYAIIAAMSRAIGAQPQDEFGVAIATRAFEKEQTQAQEKTSCAQ